MTFTDIFILLAAVATAAFLFAPKLRRSKCWQATVTPLASIIGSGFLVAAPLVAVIVGEMAPLAMLAIVVVAYGIGEIIRFNIRHLEPRLENPQQLPRKIWVIERLSGLALSAAYIVSIAFYLRLLSSFVLHQMQEDVDFYANLMTTVILLFIGVVGRVRGLHALERLEVYSVTIKLSLIVALLVGLISYDFGSIGDIFSQSIPMKDHNVFHQIRLLAGILLIVQGFETSRYLGADYDAETRIATMRRAQWVSGVIYVVFVILAMPLLTHLQGTNPDETAIIGLAKLVSPVLPVLLIIAAVMSQFSAAVADTIGGGGLIAENTEDRLGKRSGYLLITLLAVALVWFSNIFELISIASRAFAFYYLLQSINAWLIVGKCHDGGRCFWVRARIGSFILILSFVVLFGHSAE